MDARTMRIGLTMRRCPPGQAGTDARDWLSADWERFMRRVLPEALWMPLPNARATAVGLARECGLDGVLFTGGEDVGSSPERDETEAALLELCLQDGLAVAGVCRGLQFLNRALGGALSPCDEAAHVGVRHIVRPAPGADDSVFPGLAPWPGRAFEVNSFHRWGVSPEGLAPGLAALALGPGGLVEALAWPGRRLAAVQWHPERETGENPAGEAWLRALFIPVRKEEARVRRG